MARRNSGSTGTYLSLGAAVVTAAPFSVSCWVYPENTADLMCPFGIARTISSNDRDWWRFLLRGDTNDRVQWQARSDLNGQGAVWAENTTAFSANTWHHLLGVEAASNDRRVYLDGGGKGTNTGTVTPEPTSTHAFLSEYASNGFQFPMAGRVCEIAVWNVSLNDAEAAALAAGVSPRRIRPESLQLYLPVLGLDSPEPDYSGNNRNFSLTGTLPQADHAPVLSWALLAAASVTLVETGGGPTYVDGSGSATGTGTPTGVGQIELEGQASATGAATTTATGRLENTGSASVTALAVVGTTGQTELEGQGVAVGSATVTASGQLEVTGAASATASATATGAGQLEAQGDGTATGSATATASSTVTGFVDASGSSTGMATTAAVALTTLDAAPASLLATAMATSSGQVEVVGTGPVSGIAVSVASAETELVRRSSAGQLIRRWRSRPGGHVFPLQLLFDLVDTGPVTLAGTSSAIATADVTGEPAAATTLPRTIRFLASPYRSLWPAAETLAVYASPQPSDAQRRLWQVTRQLVALGELPALYQTPREQLVAERALQRELGPILRRAFERLVGLLRQNEINPGNEFEVDRALAQGVGQARESVEEAYRGRYQQAARDAFQRQARDILSKAGIDLTWSQVEPRALQLLDDLAFTASQKLLERVVGDVKGVLRDGFQQGLGTREIGDRLRDVIRGISSRQAENIARTEVNSAANTGNFLAADASGLDYGQWLTANDQRVRPTHIAQHGMVVRKGERFPDGLLHPGDRSGTPVGEWINCRCAWAVYFPLRSELTRQTPFIGRA